MLPLIVAAVQEPVVFAVDSAQFLIAGRRMQHHMPAVAALHQSGLLYREGIIHLPARTDWTNCGGSCHRRLNTGTACGAAADAPGCTLGRRLGRLNAILGQRSRIKFRAGSSCTACYAYRIFGQRELSIVTRLSGRLIVFLVFTVSRLAILASDQRESTLTGVNVRYAFEAQRAASLGMSIYKLHAESRQLEDAAIPPVERLVEYPPLTILWMKVPTWLLDPIPKTGSAPDPWVRAAKWANRIAMFVVDLCGFGILALIGATGAQLAVYTAGGLLLFPVLYDRFDLLLGVLLLGAMVLLLRKRPSWAPLTVLAVAINLKITPLVLVPLFVLGTLPENALSSPSGARPWGLIGRRLAMLSALGAALFLPFFVKDGFS